MTMTLPSIARTTPSLRDFLLRRRVLRLYRDILRATSRTHGWERHELRQWAREEFLRNRHVTDHVHIRYLLDAGTREFLTVKRYL